MAVFRFSGVSANGAAQRGTIEAADAALVVARLQQQGVIPLRVERAGRADAFSDFLSINIGTRNGFSRDDLAAIIRELATLLTAGEDMNQALQFVSEAISGTRAKRILGIVRDKVRGGGTLTAALSEAPASLPKLYVGLIRAGESSGSLPAALDNLASLMERERSLTASVQSALIYPALLVSGAVGMIYLLSRVVLPQFIPLFRQNEIAMPLPTRILMALSSGFSAAAPWLLAALIVLALLARRALADPVVRLPVDRFLLRLPLVGSLQREVIAARFCRALGTLLTNGIPLISAIAIAKETLGNLAAAKAIEEASEKARSGGSLARALEEAAIFPMRSMHLLRLGERTASLAPLVLKAAAMGEERTAMIVQRLVSLLVPTITLALGAIVAAIIGSILLAMLSLNDLVH